MQEARRGICTIRCSDALAGVFYFVAQLGSSGDDQGHSGQGWGKSGGWWTHSDGGWWLGEGAVPSIRGHRQVLSTRAQREANPWSC